MAATVIVDRETSGKSSAAKLAGQSWQWVFGRLITICQFDRGSDVWDRIGDGNRSPPLHVRFPYTAPHLTEMILAVTDAG
jgi:hypothetical protein